MRKNLYKAIIIVTILGSFAMLLMLQNANALRPVKIPQTTFQTVISAKAQRPPIYIVTDLIKTTNVIIAVEAPSYGNVAKKRLMVYPRRTAIELPWKAVDNQGYILPEVYKINISAKSFDTDQPFLIKNVGFAAGYPTPLEAINAVNITAVIPNPVEREARIVYTLGSEAAVTMDIINDEGDTIDNIIAGQQRWQGDNEEIWERSKKAKSGLYQVKVVSIDRKGIAQDFEGFACK